jgi:hypothetical protein
MRTANVLKAAATLSVALASVGLATPPSLNAMGATFKVISKGQTSTIEIRLRPRTAFDTVRVEAASGVGSLTPPCSFTAVVVGGSYSCQVNVSHKAEASSLTLNVVAERTVDAQTPRLVQVSHFTLANAEYAAPAVRHLESRDKLTPSLMLSSPPATPK